MQSVEKDGMKLYAKLGEIKGEHAAKLQADLEDCDRHGVYIYICGLYKGGTSHICLKYNLETHMSKGTVFKNLF